MKNWLILLSLGLSLGALGSACAFLGLQHFGMLGRSKSSEPVVEVNGAKLSMDDFVAQLKVTSGAEVLAQMVQQALVTQQAQKDSVKLSPQEESELSKAVGQIKDPLVRDSVLREQKSQILLRKLMLKDVSERDKRDFFDLYRNELAQYELFLIVVATESDAKAAWESLKAGSLPFDQLVRNYSLDPSNGGRVGYLSLPAIRAQLGEQAAASLAASPPNSALAPMYCSQGMMIIRVGAVLKSYEQLKPTIENIFLESKRVAYRRKLMATAKISSPFLDTSRSAQAAPEPLRLPEATSAQGLPKPGASPLPSASLAKPKLDPKNAPGALPGLKKGGSSPLREMDKPKARAK